MNGKHIRQTGFVASMTLAIVLTATGCNRDRTEKADAAVPPPESAAPVEPAAVQAPEPAPSSVAAQFAMMDTDGNGQVSTGEHAAGAGSMFATMDANGDGSVTAAEMDAGQSAVQGDARMSSADKIRTIDTNADGVLSRDEHAAGSSSMFSKMDSNGDGSLSAEEMQAGHYRMMGASEDGEPTR